MTMANYPFNFPFNALLRPAKLNRRQYARRRTLVSDWFNDHWGLIVRGAILPPACDSLRRSGFLV